jgi:cyclin B
MNNSVIEHPRTLYANQFYGRFNPGHQKVPSVAPNNAAMRKKYKLPPTFRQFGKEIIIKNNLTVYSNNEIIRTKRTFNLKNLNNKKEKTIHKNQLKNYEKNYIELNKKNKNNCIKNNNIKKFDENNKENIPNLINEKKIIDEEVTINDESKDNDNSSTIHNDDDDDLEMKDENENKNKDIIYNLHPQNVDEYFKDIVEELKNNEEKFLPEFNYMSKQKDINNRMRAILLDWLIDVHLKYKMVPQTMYISVNLIDRYLSKNETTRMKLQCVGVASMFIASKYEEIYPPELKDFVYITDRAYVKSEVLEMEYKMLTSLNFDITFPTQWSFFEIFTKKLKLVQKVYYLAWFLMELSLINYKMMKFKYSQIAASSILIAIKALNYFNVVEFEKDTGYKESELNECIKEINSFNVYNSTHSLQAIRKKFSSKKYLEVSKIQLY